MTAPSENDQVRAYHPVTGKLHSSSPAYPWFEDAMRRQGFRTVRIPEAEYRASLGGLRSRPAAGVSEQEGVSALSPLPPTSSRPDLPAVGDWVETELLGRMCITHTVTLPDEAGPLPVGVGPRGTGVVRPGTWVPAPAPVDTSPPPPLPSAPKPQAALPTPPLSQPTLFDLEVTQ